MSEYASADDIVQWIGEELAHPGGELVIRHRGGEIRVSTDGRFWGELDERAQRLFAERLAAISEDGAAILACIDGDPEGGEPSSYRRVDVSTWDEPVPGGAARE